MIVFHQKLLRHGNNIFKSHQRSFVHVTSQPYFCLALATLVSPYFGDAIHLGLFLTQKVKPCNKLQGCIVRLKKGVGQHSLGYLRLFE
jgi:hypothetical protein